MRYAALGLVVLAGAIMVGCEKRENPVPAIAPSSAPPNPTNPAVRSVTTAPTGGPILAPGSPTATPGGTTMAPTGTPVAPGGITGPSTVPAKPGGR